MEESYIHVNSQDKRDVICTTLNEAGGTGLRPLELRWVHYESQMVQKYRILCFLCCILPLILDFYALVLVFGK